MFVLALLRFFCLFCLLLFFLFVRPFVALLYYYSKPVHSLCLDRISTVFSRAVCLVVGLEVKHYGTVPDKPFILVSNHLSYMDIPVLGSLVGGCFVSDMEVRSIPIIGSITSLFPTVFVGYSKRSLLIANNRICGLLEGGRGVILFPEGITSRGDYLRHFNSPLLECSIETSTPVAYCIIKYDTLEGYTPPSQSICWWEQSPLLIHVFNILCMPSFSASVTFSDNRYTAKNRKDLARRLESKIKDQPYYSS